MMPSQDFRIGLKRGNQGTGVTWLQNFLHRFGYLQVEKKDESYSLVSDLSASRVAISATAVPSRITTPMMTDCADSSKIRLIVVSNRGRVL
ncbi:hypothetical protein [Peribacillus sp. FSL R5-0717]|uniref:hypothetical protein n=1 Tax=Peribacillus sp. FSL R5-0717 TaxID=2975308 RepID=UPI0030F66EA7